MRCALRVKMRLRPGLFPAPHWQRLTDDRSPDPLQLDLGEGKTGMVRRRGAKGCSRERDGREGVGWCDLGGLLPGNEGDGTPG